MDNDLTPLEILTRFNELKADLELIQETSQNKITDLNEIVNRVDGLINNLNNITNLDDKIKNSINDYIPSLLKQINDEISKIQINVTDVFKLEYIKDLETNTKIIKEQIEKDLKELSNIFKDLEKESREHLYRVLYNNRDTCNDLKNTNSKIDSLSYKISDRINTFEYIISLKWFWCPLFYTCLGIVIAILINKFILINVFNYYQTEQTTKAIQEINNQNNLILLQQKAINEEYIKENYLNKYDIKFIIDDKSNRPYLLINKNKYKGKLIKDINKHYDLIELIK